MKIHTVSGPQKGVEGVIGLREAEISKEKLAGFRQGLTLHISVELRYTCPCLRSAFVYKTDSTLRIDVLSFQQINSFQAFDDATREGARKILKALSHNRDHLVAATDAQTKQMKALHRQTETILTQEFGLVAANIAEQSETTRALTVKEQQKTRMEVLNAVAVAPSGYMMLYPQK